MDRREHEIASCLECAGTPAVFIVETAQGKEVPGSRTVAEFDIDNLFGRLENPRQLDPTFQENSD